MRFCSFVLVLAAGCGVAPRNGSHPKDFVATAAGQARLFRLEDQQIIRTDCRTDTVLRDRATCATGERTATAAKVLDLTEPQIGVGIDAKDRELAELAVNVGRVDEHLLEILASGEPSDVGPIKAEIIRHEQKIQDLTGELAGLTDQIARIKGQLRTNDSADLRLQLSVLVGDHSKTTKSLKDERTVLEAARNRLIDASGEPSDPELYTALRQQRQAIVGQMTTVSSTIDSLVADRIAYRRVVRLLEDQGAAFDLTVGENAFAREREVVAVLAKEFDKVAFAEEEARALAEALRKAAAVAPLLDGTYTCESTWGTPRALTLTATHFNPEDGGASFKLSFEVNSPPRRGARQPSVVSGVGTCRLKVGDAVVLVCASREAKRLDTAWGGSWHRDFYSTTVLNVYAAGQISLAYDDEHSIYDGAIHGYRNRDLWNTTGTCRKN